MKNLYNSAFHNETSNNTWGYCPSKIKSTMLKLLQWQNCSVLAKFTKLHQWPKTSQILKGKHQKFLVTRLSSSHFKFKRVISDRCSTKFSDRFCFAFNFSVTCAVQIAQLQYIPFFKTSKMKHSKMIQLHIANEMDSFYAEHVLLLAPKMKSFSEAS